MDIDQIQWLELAKLGVAALTPIMTGVLGILIVRMGTKLDVTKQLHQELLRKRLHLFEDLAPQINDIYCFFQAVGHWAELNPEEIIKRKRAIDRSIAVNRYLFHSSFWSTYQRFEAAHFDMFGAAGQAARLRLDVDHARKLLGDRFKPEWLAFMSAQPGSHEEQKDAYHALMRGLGDEMKAV
jgi:hypothetical protein